MDTFVFKLDDECRIVKNKKLLVKEIHRPSSWVPLETD